jgi:hypothetical protein
MRRKLIIGLVAMGLTATAVHAPAYHRICSSGVPSADRIAGTAKETGRSEAVCHANGPARSFRQYFEDLKTGSSLSPIERFVFSLVLANAKTAECPVETVAPPDRT